MTVRLSQFANAPLEPSLSLTYVPQTSTLPFTVTFRPLLPLNTDSLIFVTAYSTPSTVIVSGMVMSAGAPLFSSTTIAVALSSSYTSTPSSYEDPSGAWKSIQR